MPCDAEHNRLTVLLLPFFFQFALNNEMNKTIVLIFCIFASTNAFLWNNNQGRNLVELWNDQGRRNYKRSNTYSLRSFSQKYPDYYDEDVVPAHTWPINCKLQSAKTVDRLLETRFWTRRWFFSNIEQVCFSGCSWFWRSNSFQWFE